MFIPKSILLVLSGVMIVLGYGWWSHVSLDRELKPDNSTVTPASIADTLAGQLRPAFKLPDLEGNWRDVSEWDGKVLVVNFWATWCPPCQREIPAFLALQAEYGSQGLQFIGIALDEVDAVQDTVDTLGIDYPILLGSEAAATVSKAYGNRFGALPYTVVIDRSGQIVSTFRGELKKPVAEALLQRLL